MRWNLRSLGHDGPPVSPITLGGAPLGGMPENFGYDVTEDDALRLLSAVLDSDIRTIDTANGYANGRSERRIGQAIAAHGGLPPDVVVITKVDPSGADFSGERVRRSLAESRERLGIDFLPVVHLHDPEFHDFAELAAPGGAIEALVQARQRGEIGQVGLAGGDVRVMARYLELGFFDVLLVHNRWTIVDRSAGPIIERALELGVSVVNAAVLGGGILADETGRMTTYGYRPASSATVRAIGDMRDICRRYGTDLASAAIRWSTRDARITSTVVGISKVSRLNSTIAAAIVDVPDELWTELEAITPGPQHWLEPSPW